MINSRDKLYNFLHKYYQKEKTRIAGLNKKIKNEQSIRQYINHKDYLLYQIQAEIVNLLKKNFLNFDILEEDIILEEPPLYIQADFCFACFGLGKKIKKPPLLLAEEISEIINKNTTNLSVKQSEAKAAYVNLILKKEIHFNVLKQVLFLNEKYGESDFNKKKIVLIDYSSPNIAKPIGLNHLPSTIIGEVLANIYFETGASVIRHNYLGDWGTNFGALLWAYFHWGNDEKIKKDGVEELKNLYVRFFDNASKNEKLIKEARELFNRLENGDLKLLKIWKKFRDLSVKDFIKTYKRLGIQFDTYLGESYFLEETEELLEEAINKGVAIKKDDNLVVIESLDELPSFLLRKEDGSTLYLTRDAAALKVRFELFNLELILYVVGSEQSLHFQQLFALAKNLGYLDDRKRSVHIPFGLILIEGKKMATRKGSLIGMNNLIDEAVRRAKQIILKKSPQLAKTKIDKIAEQVGLGAVIYNSLKQSRLQNINFDWDEVLNFESASAPYLQYSCVRIKSILEKVRADDLRNLSEENIKIYFKETIEFDLLKKLMIFPVVIWRAQKENSPHFICIYLEELAQLFNRFYDSISVIKTIDDNLRNSRIMLIKAVHQVLEKGMNLLNIKTPSKM